MIKKLALVLVLVANLNSLTAAVTPAAAQAYIKTMISDGITYWKDKPFDDQVKKFREVMETKFDLDGIAKRVLGGRLWDLLDKPQKDAYLVAFREMLLNRYSKKFSGYGGETIIVTGASSSVKRFPIGVDSNAPQPQIVVNSQLRSSGGSPIKIEWYVGEENGKPVVTDITLAGPSMVDTEKATFASIQRNPQNFGQAKQACASEPNRNKCIASKLMLHVMKYMNESK